MRVHLVVIGLHCMLYSNSTNDTVSSAVKLKQNSERLDDLSVQ